MAPAMTGIIPLPWPSFELGVGVGAGGSGVGLGSGVTGAAGVAGAGELGAGMALDAACVTAGLPSSPQPLRAAASSSTVPAARCGAETRRAQRRTTGT
jgi:hypothetical protein